MDRTRVAVVDKKLETLLAHMVLQVDDILQEGPLHLKGSLVAKIEDFMARLHEIVDRRLHVSGRDQSSNWTTRTSQIDPDLPSSVYAGIEEVRETFISDLSPAPSTPIEPSYVTQPIAACYPQSIESEASRLTSRGQEHIVAKKISKKRKQDDDDGHGERIFQRLQSTLRSDGRTPIGDIPEFLAGLDFSWLETVKSEIRNQLRRDDRTSLQLLVQCFVAIGSPHAFEQLRRALPSIRDRRSFIVCTGDFGDIMIELERTGADATALVLRRRLNLLSVRRHHQETIAMLLEQNSGDRAATASLDTMVRRVVNSNGAQEPRIKELLGDEASVRNKIIKYLALARNWDAMTSNGHSALLLLLLSDGDLFDLSASKIERLSSRAFDVLLEAVLRFRGGFLSKVSQKLMPYLQDVIEGRSAVKFKFETCDLSELRQIALDSHDLLQLCEISV